MPGKSNPHDGKSSSLFTSLITIDWSPSFASPNETSPITSSPVWLFCLCWAQCSCSDWSSLIVALLAYFSLVEAKHGFSLLFLSLWHPGRRGSANASWLMVWPCEARQACLIAGKLGEIKEELICLPSPDLPPLHARQLQFVEEIRWENMMAVRPSFPAGSPFLHVGRNIFCLLLRPIAIRPRHASPIRAVSLLGQQVLIRWTTDHTAQQLFTHCCACTHGQWTQMQTCCHL